VKGTLELRRRASLTLAAALAASTLGAQEAIYKVIVNSANPAASLKRELIAQLFMSRKLSWGHGPAVDPVDQSMTSPIREAFSREILGMPTLGVQNHWRKRVLENREYPPLVKANDAEVIAHVAKSQGGIGYVAVGTPLPATVKVVGIPDPIR
jgi:ABC-type phosphate transport system substrate-binding protein